MSTSSSGNPSLQSLVAIAAVLAAAACGDRGDGEGDEDGGEDGWSGPPEVCSTEAALREEESPLMEPGGDCIGCHGREGEGPGFAIAGTVMGDFRDDTNCNGIEAVTVRITGVDGSVRDLVTNSAGNFFSGEPVALPFTAKLLYQGMERVMMAPQTDGDCAHCHTAAGANGAPGRIVVPAPQ